MAQKKIYIVRAHNGCATDVSAWSSKKAADRWAASLKRGGFKIDEIESMPLYSNTDF